MTTTTKGSSNTRRTKPTKVTLDDLKEAYVEHLMQVKREKAPKGLSYSATIRHNTAVGAIQAGVGEIFYSVMQIPRLGFGKSNIPSMFKIEVDSDQED